MAKRLIGSVLVFVLAAGAACDPACAQSQPNEPASAATGEPDLSPGTASFAAGAPAALDVKRAKTGHLLVHAKVNGGEAGWFIFDTGAGICVLSRETAGKLALKPSGTVSAIGVGGAKNSAVFRVDTLELGAMTLKDHPMMEADLAFLTPHTGEPIAGVIGFGVLSRCVAEVSLADTRIALHDPATYALSSGEWSELILRDRVPAVHATFEGHEGVFRLDTGATGMVTFHEPAVQRWSLLEGREVQDSKLGGVGGFVSAKRGVISSFELCGLTLRDITADFALEAKGSFANPNMDGNIGADLARRFVIVLDYGHERIAFKRPEKAAER